MKFFAVLSLALVFVPVSFAQQQSAAEHRTLAQHETFVVSPDASEIKMTLKTTHELVTGTFHIQSGSIEFDRGNPKMAGSVVVLAGSGTTGNDSRDKKMNTQMPFRTAALRVPISRARLVLPRPTPGRPSRGDCWQPLR